MHRARHYRSTAVHGKAWKCIDHASLKRDQTRREISTSKAWEFSFHAQSSEVTFTARWRTLTAQAKRGLQGGCCTLAEPTCQMY